MDLGPTRSVFAQCPSCGLHELVAIPLGQSANGQWVQLDRQRWLRRVPTTTTASLQIDACPVCFGAWFDAGELDKLTDAPEGIESALNEPRGPSPRTCVRGHGSMLEHELPGILRTRVDRCATCGGLWLDGHERRRLAKASTAEGQGTQKERWLTRGAIWAAQVITSLPVEVENPARTTPWIVYLALAVFFAVFLGETVGAIDIDYYGIVPGRLKIEGDTFTLFTYMFLHGSWPHLLSNAYFLYTFGDNIEHLFGRLRFAVFFIATGVIAGAAHAWLTRKTAMPVVGASGSIAGVLAAYLWAFPRQRLFQVVLWIQLKIPVWVYLFVWVALHIVMGLGSAGASSAQVAWFAHLGGFAAGIAVSPLMLSLRRRAVARAVAIKNLGG